MTVQTERIVAAIRGDDAARAAAESLDWDAVSELLNAAAIEQLDRRPYSLATIGERCGDLLQDVDAGLLARRLFAGTLQVAIENKVTGYAELIVAQQALAAGLLTLWQPDRQEMIAALSGGWPEPIAAAVLQLGRRFVSIAVRDGLGTVDATIAETAWKTEALAARITNAAALMHERLTVEQSPAEAADVVALAWTDSEGE